MAFFSFFYSRLSQFKGFGFEAELWEDKTKEAEGLIERLKSVVEISTREIVLTKVMQGRWSDGADWAVTGSSLMVWWQSTLIWGFQRLFVSRPVRGLVFCRMPTADAVQLSCWIHAVDPTTNLYSKAGLSHQTD